MTKTSCIDWLMRLVRAFRAVVGGKERTTRHQRLADLMAEARRLQAEAEAPRT